jgi:hypothetical protein
MQSVPIITDVASSNNIIGPRVKHWLRPLPTQPLTGIQMGLLRNVLSLDWQLKQPELSVVANPCDANGQYNLTYIYCIAASNKINI